MSIFTIHITISKKIPYVCVYRILPSEFLFPKSLFASLSFVSSLSVFALLAMLVAFSFLTALSATISTRQSNKLHGATSDYESLNRREISKIVTPPLPPSVAHPISGITFHPPSSKYNFVLSRLGFEFVFFSFYSSLSFFSFLFSSSNRESGYATGLYLILISLYCYRVFLRSRKGEGRRREGRNQDQLTF